MKLKSLLILPLLVASLQAASVSDLTFTLVNGNTEYSVSDCVNTVGGSLDIPSTYNGLPVTSILYQAFYGCFRLTSVTIPNSVTSIGDRAFYNCSGLTSISIGDNVTSIGDQAFYNCSGLTSISIGDNVTTIGTSVFYDCSSLSSITIPDSVTSIGNQAFQNCYALKRLNIGKGINLNNWNFLRDAGSGVKLTLNELAAPITNSQITLRVTQLESTNRYIKDIVEEISISSNVSSIEDNTVNGFTAITSITIPDNITSIGSSAFQDCSSLTSIIIPDSVTSIGSSAFRNCSNLASITIPDGVTSIGGSAFSSCGSLASITIPDSVTSIGGWAFSSCGSLASITIPDSVTSIGEYAFNSCSSLINITIPDSVTSIGGSAFQNCSGLISITFEGPPPAFEIATFANLKYQTILYYKAFHQMYSVYKEAYNMPLVYLGPPTINRQPQGAIASIGEAVNLSVLATDFESSQLSYQWMRNGVDIVEETTSVLSITSITSIDGGSYQVKVSNTAGTTTSEAASVTLLASDLYTPSEMATARTESRTLGQQDVISSPSDYGLIGAEGVFDMRVSQPGISTNGDKASMNFTIQSSNDLEQWNNEETIRRDYTMPSDKNFMRVSVGPQLEPEPLVAIATDTYGDKLVYDESNNLYVNDENTPLKRNGVNLKTDAYSSWNFYAIESTDSGYLCLLKKTNRYGIITFGLDGNYLSVSFNIDASAYEDDFGQSLD